MRSGPIFSLPGRLPQTAIASAITLLALLAGSPEANAKACGNLPSAHGASDTITVRNIRGNRGCAVARRVAKQWQRKVVKNQCNFVTNCQARRFTCRGSEGLSGIGGLKIYCERSNGYLIWNARQILPAD